MYEKKNVPSGSDSFGGGNDGGNDDGMFIFFRRRHAGKCRADGSGVRGDSSRF